MATLEDLTAAAESEWLARWTTGPTEDEGFLVQPGSPAADLILADHTGRDRNVSEFWADGPALLMFWRHFGCGCGVERAVRLKAEWQGYIEAGVNPVIVAQGEPSRAAAYRATHDLPCTILCDPDHRAYRAYGIGQWQVERIIADTPEEFWSHPRDIGVSFQTARREQGRPLVDDPWRAVKEFVIGTNGLVRLSHSCQYCEDFPNPKILAVAARLS